MAEIISDSIGGPAYIINEIISRVNPTKVSYMTCLSNFTQSNGYCPVIAGTTPVYTGQLVQPVNGTLTPIGSGAITTMTLTLTDTLSNGIVNNVDAVDIFNTGRGTIDANGNITIALLVGDTSLYNPNNTVEERAMMINYSFNGGIKVGSKEVLFTVSAT